MDMAAMFPQFGNLPVTVLGFLLALTIIVGIHEYGHYIVGRWSGIHAEVFSIGFGPVLWSRVDKHGTRWQIAALPLGGYVRFLGDANAASVGGDGVSHPNPRRTMTWAPLWARITTVLAGPVFNFILSIVIYTAIFMYSGTMTTPPTIASLQPLPPAMGVTLQPGDAIISIAGQPVDEGVSVANLSVENPLPYVVERDGRQIDAMGPYPQLPIVGSLMPNLAAHQAGLQIGDVVMAVDGAPVAAIGDVISRVSASMGAPVTFTIWRAGQTFDRELLPRMIDLPLPEGGYARDWKVGFSSTLPYTFQTEPMGVLPAIARAGDTVWYLVTRTLEALGSMITGVISAEDNLQGMVGMAQSTGMVVEQGLLEYAAWIALLSASIGLLNLLPVPMLDGGHLVFYLWEAVTRRRVPDRVAWALMLIGLAMVITLMVFALSLDIRRLISW
ncbi:membrane-associated zinc metalloprotease [Ketogulonicigenium vulgare]|uniref:RIP metalloprotease RseP n=1 Tax=Ketogulonicigenium vulgare TaxID=92945 RepID=UPI0008AA76CA|nr:RIP metalloprotease RseP [Ketogulonicigenium vulgare]AOZ54601.1 membrane-associated zinc metalloprotease [Ketogulonicigenium vulgare]